MKKTVLFVPGFPETINSRNYRSTMAAISGKGYNVVFVPINWKYKTAEQWAQQLRKTYVNYDAKTTVLSGFSYGAVAALMVASGRNPSELWLFSLSPYFAEDFPIKQQWLDYIGKRRTKFFKTLSFNDLAKSISCKTISWAGEKEMEKYPSLGIRAKEAGTVIANGRFVEVSGADHDVADERYIGSITSQI